MMTRALPSEPRWWSAKLLVLVSVIAACRSGPTASSAHANQEIISRMTGVWYATLYLKQPYELALADPPASRICGTIAFVDAHSVTGDPDDLGSDGVYRLNLARLGLDWRNERQFPAAVAVQGLRQNTAGRSDSVSIVLNPGSSERIVLLGRHHSDGIDGQWTAQSLRGTASGSFSLRRRSESGQQCQVAAQ